VIVVGVDGGGTKTEMLAVDEAGTVVGQGGAGPSNVHRLGIAGVSKEIVRNVAAVIPADRNDSVLVVACLAGVDTAEMRVALTAALVECEPDWEWIVENDAAAAWRGAFDGMDAGVVTIAGTGAVSFGRSGQVTARTGGWGALLGDEGSGYSVGHAALVAVLRDQDGLGPATQLTGPVLNALGLTQSHEIIDRVHGGMSFEDVASLAPIVIAMAEDEHDGVARHILELAADALVLLSDGAAARLGATSAAPIGSAYVGGLAGNAYFRDMVRKRQAASRLTVWSEPRESALMGAVLLGADRIHNRDEYSGGFYVDSIERDS
jgi:N-acetylglucosamine kinase-like BadF-type ATPase